MPRRLDLNFRLSIPFYSQSFLIVLKSSFLSLRLYLVLYHLFQLNLFLKRLLHPNQFRNYLVHSDPMLKIHLHLREYKGINYRIASLDFSFSMIYNTTVLRREQLNLLRSTSIVTNLEVRTVSTTFLYSLFFLVL